MITTRRSKFTAVGVIGTLLLGGGTAAVAATSVSTPAGGSIHVFVNGNVKSQTVLPILITGAIGDYGTATSKDKNGKVDPDGSYIQVALKKGAFLVDAVALDKKLSKAVPLLNSSTCSETFIGSGPTSISKGTGLYAGIGGAVTITETFAGIAPRLASGKCNLSQNSEPIAQYISIVGVGKVKF